MRFFVTGANGLVGSRLCRLLASKGHEVVGAGRGPRRAEGGWSFRTVELTREVEISQALDDASPEVVVNTASMTEVDACEKDPQAAFGANVDAAAHLARASSRLGAHLVHVSTDYVFDGDRGRYSETDLPNPRGVYALTKHIGEEAVKVFAPGAAICRTAVVYGWPQAARPNFGAWLVQALEKKQQLKLFEDQFVSPSLADSVAEMLAEVGERRLGGIWNTCGAEAVNRIQFGRAVCEVFGFDSALLVPTKMKDLKLASPRPLNSSLDASKAARELSAKPLALAEALKRFHAAYRGTP
jgi:dTDP-4-dehydrorhamnose reductase